jgi:hypothetical protein
MLLGPESLGNIYAAVRMASIGIWWMLSWGVVMAGKKEWLAVLTDEQRELRKQGRFDEIELTKEQQQILGEAGCCWIESPSFYAQSQWCD